MSGLLSSTAQLLLIIPFLIFAKNRNRGNSLTPVFYLMAIYLVIELLTNSLSGIRLFPGQQWNWMGKGVGLIAEIMLCFVITGFTRRQFGLTTQIHWSGAKPIGAACLILILLHIGLYLFSGQAVSKGLHPETLLFQATLPGLQEELLFRGLLLGLLNRAFPNPAWTFLKVRFGWAVVITSILFGAAHGISYQTPHITAAFFDGFTMNYPGFFRTLIDGFFLALLVQKTKSIFPSVIVHGILNLIGNH